MPGAIFQLNLKGKQDIFLTGNPEINFIKQVYKRYINFASEVIRIAPNDISNFGSKMTVEIPRKGDFLHKMSFAFGLPPLKVKSGTYVGWTNSIGHAMIDYVDLEIGGLLVDRNYGLYMEIWHELTVKPGTRSIDDAIIGKYDHMKSLQVNANYPTSYTIPLKFWFCNNLGSAFPLLSLQYHSIKVIFNFRKFSECIVYDGDIPPDPVDIFAPNIVGEYIYIDDIYREKYIGAGHKFLISQIQHISGVSVGSGSVSRIHLPFNNPVSELLWILRETESGLNNDWFNFSQRDVQLEKPVFPLMKEARLLLDGKERVEAQLQLIYNTLLIARYHTNITSKHIYILPFCNEPEKWYPTGSLNFSRIQTAELIVETFPNIKSSTIYVFAKNFNYLYVSEGMARLEFSV